METSVFKRTSDSWYDNYIIVDDARVKDLVEVSFYSNICAYDKTLRPVSRTCVWGNDDCGMEFDSENETEAWNMFLQVIGMEDVTKEKLKCLGFVMA